MRRDGRRRAARRPSSPPPPRKAHRGRRSGEEGRSSRALPEEPAASREPIGLRRQILRDHGRGRRRGRAGGRAVRRGQKRAKKGGGRRKAADGGGASTPPPPRPTPPSSLQRARLVAIGRRRRAVALALELRIGDRRRGSCSTRCRRSRRRSVSSSPQLLSDAAAEALCAAIGSKGVAPALLQLDLAQREMSAAGRDACAAALAPRREPTPTLGAADAAADAGGGGSAPADPFAAFLGGLAAEEEAAAAAASEWARSAASSSSPSMLRRSC